MHSMKKNASFALKFMPDCLFFSCIMKKSWSIVIDSLQLYCSWFLMYPPQSSLFLNRTVLVYLGLCTMKKHTVPLIIHAALFFIFSTSFTHSLKSYDCKILQPNIMDLPSDITKFYDQCLMISNTCNHFICLSDCHQTLCLHSQGLQGLFPQQYTAAIRIVWLFPSYVLLCIYQ